MHPAAGSVLRADGGPRIRLGKLIKSGGAGSVYRVVDDPARVAKIYHAGPEVARYERRVLAMLALSPELPPIDEAGRHYVQVAWPEAALRDDAGRFVGFIMPAVDVDATAELELILQDRQARAHGLPTGLGAKVTLAANLAAVLAELHRQGHHVVDLKPVNVRFYPRSLYMALLDCDGFSIAGRGERFHAPQFTPDYLAPEFHPGGPTTAGEEHQDRFALAVVVFQLLNSGLHPYSGRPASDAVPSDIPGRIARRLYAYGARANPMLAASPASGHAAIASDLRRLFDRAFETTGALRPSAAEWAQALRSHAARSHGRLVTCTRDDDHQHFAGLPCAACARAAMIADAGRRAGEAKRQTERRVAGAVAAARSRAPQRHAPRAAAPARPTAGYPAPGGSGHGSGSGRGAPAWSPAPLPGWPSHPRPLSRTGSWPPPKPTTGCAPIVMTAFALAAIAMMLLSRCGPQRPTYEPPPYYGTAGKPVRTAPVPPAVAAQKDGARHEAVVRGLIAAVLGHGDTEYLDALRRLRDLAPPAKTRATPAMRTLAGVPALLVMTPGEREARLGLLDDLVEARPGEPDGLLRRGLLRLAAGRGDEARADVLQALRLDPTQPGMWAALALVEHDAEARVGALAIAGLHAADAREADVLRGYFDAIVALLGQQRNDWAVIQAHARLIVSTRTGEPLPPSVRTLANQPLPR